MAAGAVLAHTLLDTVWTINEAGWPGDSIFHH